MKKDYEQALWKWHINEWLYHQKFGYVSVCIYIYTIKGQESRTSRWKHVHWIVFSKTAKKIQSVTKETTFSENDSLEIQNQLTLHQLCYNLKIVAKSGTEK